MLQLIPLESVEARQNTLPSRNIDTQELGWARLTFNLEFNDRWSFSQNIETRVKVLGQTVALAGTFPSSRRHLDVP